MGNIQARADQLVQALDALVTDKSRSRHKVLVESAIENYRNSPCAQDRKMPASKEVSAHIKEKDRTDSNDEREVILLDCD